MTENPRADDVRLAECPFCGCEKVHPPTMGDYTCWATCSNPDCWISGPEAHSIAEAVEKWNTRATLARRPVEGGEDVLPCDVRLPPATIISAGCSFETLRLAMNVPGRPKTFEERKFDPERARRLGQATQPDQGGVTGADREAAAQALGYKTYADATDYRLTSSEDRRVANMVQAFARHRRQSACDLVDENARLREALNAIDQEASNTVEPDGAAAAFAALRRIVKLINPHRLPFRTDMHDG